MAKTMIRCYSITYNINLYLVMSFSCMERLVPLTISQEEFEDNTTNCTPHLLKVRKPLYHIVTHFVLEDFLQSLFIYRKATN